MFYEWLTDPSLSLIPFLSLQCCILEYLYLTRTLIPEDDMLMLFLGYILYKIDNSDVTSALQSHDVGNDLINVFI